VKENARHHKPARFKYSILAQLRNLIPSHLVSTLAHRYGVTKKTRTFSPWSHVVALLYAQLVHALSLNDVCDALRTHASKLGQIRNAVAPAKNTLSHANRTRPSAGGGNRGNVPLCQMQTAWTYHQSFWKRRKVEGLKQ
jgi:hypothetical protein